jgi:ATP-dependent helicase/nuclease subunit A
MNTPSEIANHQQTVASNPLVSAFVAASAGSGKTKLLTDRILRLLLNGTPPRKILCLTYTKAAAAEMAIRLNNRLGAWVMMPEDALGTELSKLDVTASPKNLAMARQLFAEILDVPGGMRISTIHAFCQSLLKRFPLEARLSPHFEIEDETDTLNRIREARELTLSEPSKVSAIFSLAAETNELDFAKTVIRLSQEGTVQSLIKDIPKSSLQSMQASAINATEISETELMLTSIQIQNRAELLKCLNCVAGRGTKTGQSWAHDCLEWLALTPDVQQDTWTDWWNCHFTNAGSRRVISKFLGKNLVQEQEQLLAIIAIEHDRLEHIMELKKAARLKNFNAALFELLTPIVRTYQSSKIEHSLLSYADLVSITLDLLSSTDQISWILYKLDEGIDHLLLDEVQDTSPAQWQITEAVAGEFFSGEGARDACRTIFAVGDDKQSIFSFQGADLNSFDRARREFRLLVENAGRTWLDGKLSVSFRSTEPVLSLVDAIFSDGDACRGVCSPNGLKHVVNRGGQAGRVTLWPLTKSLPAEPPPDWDVPDVYVSEKSEKALLAAKIASHIKARLNCEEFLPSRKRRLTAGDFLILVRHRDELVSELTRAFKALDVPVAGVDRLALTQQQAVSDLLALCDSLLLPSDDLAFAQYLVSPLGGLSDDSLMELAIGRAAPLSATLFARRMERDVWSQANDFFQTLRRQVDFISPFSLLALTLGSLGGRAKLLRRLGTDAAEAIDELMAEAQSYAQSHPASLQQFVFDLRQSGATIRREPETIGDVVRIMTVHGAKGLQAPIVILPDTTSLPKVTDNLFWLKVPHQSISVPILCPHKDLRSNAVADAAAEAKHAQMAEYNRLLYVALTRAEDELIICGSEGTQKAPVECWYNLVGKGFLQLPYQHSPDGSFTYHSPQTAEPDRISKQESRAQSDLPAWAGAAPDWQPMPPPVETRRPEPLAPSRSIDEDRPIPSAISPLSNESPGGKNLALTKGKVVHALLQHLPDLPRPERFAAAREYLCQAGFGLSETMQSEIERSLVSVLDNPATHALFGPESRAEVPLAGIVGDVEIGGLVDRLVVEANCVTIADFKTDRRPPADITLAPDAYLRQLAAYHAILSQIYPEKVVFCQIIWTETGICMPIPTELLARHAPARAQPFAIDPHA